MRRCTRTLGSALLATACFLGAASVPMAVLGGAARPALAAAADGGGLLEPTPLILKDGRIAHVSIHLIPFEQGRGELAQVTAGRLDQLTQGIATDCFLTAQVIGHVEPNEVEGGNTLGAHRLARSRADAVQGMLVDGGLPARSIASVWDWQFLVREPRVTLWLFRLSEGEDCDGTPLRPGAAPPQVAATEPPAAPAAPQPTASAPAAGQQQQQQQQQRTQVADAAAGAEAADADAAAPAPVPQAAEQPADSLPVPTAEAPRPPAAAVAVAPAPSKPAPVPPPQDIRTTEVTPPSPPVPPAPSVGEAAEAAIGTQARAMITPDQELMAVVGPRGETPAAAGAGLETRAGRPAPGAQEPQPAERAQQRSPAETREPPAPPPPPPATAATARAEPPAPPPAPPADAAGGQPAAGAVRVTFPVNSSYFGEDARRELAGLVRSIRDGGRYRVQLTASVGTGDVQGASHEDAVRYNRWLATRRLERVQEWLQENVGAELQIEPAYREDPSRQVEVRVVPAG